MLNRLQIFSQFALASFFPVCSGRGGRQGEKAWKSLKGAAHLARKGEEQTLLGSERAPSGLGSPQKSVLPLLREHTEEGHAHSKRCRCPDWEIAFRDPLPLHHPSEAEGGLGATIWGPLKMDASAVQSFQLAIFFPDKVEGGCWYLGANVNASRNAFATCMEERQCLLNEIQVQKQREWASQGTSGDLPPQPTAWPWSG